MTPLRVSKVSRPYWLAIPEAERLAIEAMVPADHQLVIVPGHHAAPGTCDVSLRDATNSSVVTPVRGRLSASLCWRVLPHVTFTVDAGGYVREIA